MKQLYQATDLIEANLLKGMLQAEGYAVQLSGEALAGAAGELPPSVQQVWLWIEEQDFSVARQLLDDYEHRIGKEWICNRCGEHNHGNFELCWQCSQPLAE